MEHEGKRAGVCQPTTGRIGEVDVVLEDVFKGILKPPTLKKLKTMTSNRSKLKRPYRICMYGEILGPGASLMVDMIFV